MDKKRNRTWYAFGRALYTLGAINHKAMSCWLVKAQATVRRTTTGTIVRDSFKSARFALCALLLAGCGKKTTIYDVVIRNGTIYDGSGRPPIRADVAISGDTIAAIGRLATAQARQEIDATGYAVAPGFINLVSPIDTSRGGRLNSDLGQGVTLEVVQETGRHGGIYSSPLQGQGNALLRSLDALIDTSRSGQVAVEINELGASGPLLDSVIAKVNAARAAGQHISADINTSSLSEEQIRKLLPLSWVSAHGNFARVVGKYARDERVIPLAGAVRELTGLPAENLKLGKRGLLKPGYFADVVVFDPIEVTDNTNGETTPTNATGVLQVFVNGVQVLLDGKATGAVTARVVRAGWTGGKKTD